MNDKPTIVVAFACLALSATLLCGCGSSSGQSAPETNEPPAATQDEAPAQEAPKATKFSLRNGITFGMTLQQVEQAEDDEGTVSPTEGVNKLIYTPTELDGVALGRAAQGTLYYRFNRNQLWEIQYWSGYYESLSEAQGAFDTWSNVITSTYGNPLPEAESSGIEDTDGLAFYRNLGSDFEKECVSLRQWDLEIDGLEIRIDLFILPSMDDYQTFCFFECPSLHEDSASSQSQAPEEDSSAITDLGTELDETSLALLVGTWVDNKTKPTTSLDMRDNGTCVLEFLTQDSSYELNWEVTEHDISDTFNTESIYLSYTLDGSEAATGILFNPTYGLDDSSSIPPMISLTIGDQTFIFIDKK